LLADLTPELTCNWRRLCTARSVYHLSTLLYTAAADIAVQLQPSGTRTREPILQHPCQAHEQDRSRPALPCNFPRAEDNNDVFEEMLGYTPSFCALACGRASVDTAAPLRTDAHLRSRVPCVNTAEEAPLRCGIPVERVSMKWGGRRTTMAAQDGNGGARQCCVCGRR
jgi:hypothetical protein